MAQSQSPEIAALRTLRSWQLLKVCVSYGLQDLQGKNPAEIPDIRMKLPIRDQIQRVLALRQNIVLEFSACIAG